MNNPVWITKLEVRNFKRIVARLGLEGPGELEVIDGWGPAPEDAPQREGDDDG